MSSADHSPPGLGDGAGGSRSRESAGVSPAAAAIRGDPDAIRTIWEQHRRWVAAVLLAHKPREADVDDLLQEVARLVVAKVADLRDEAALKPWLRTVAISVARTAARRRRPESWWRRLGADRPENQPRPEIDQTQGALEEGRRLMRLASELPEGYREPLLMKCVRGMTYRQIGELLDLPETTVETRIARGRRMLRELAEKAQAQERQSPETSTTPTTAIGVAAKTR